VHNRIAVFYSQCGDSADGSRRHFGDSGSICMADMMW